jgi:hypothetical protein
MYYNNQNISNHNQNNISSDSIINSYEYTNNSLINNLKIINIYFLLRIDNKYEIFTLNDLNVKHYNSLIINIDLNVIKLNFNIT